MLRIYTSYEANVFMRVSFIALSFQLNCLRTSNKLSLGGVDTSKAYLLSRTLLLLFLLKTCVICIQLTWIDIVFSRITLVSSFCAENQPSGKIPENMTKIQFHQKI